MSTEPADDGALADHYAQRYASMPAAGFVARILRWPEYAYPIGGDGIAQARADRRAKER